MEIKEAQRERREAIQIAFVWMIFALSAIAIGFVEIVDRWRFGG